MRALWRASKNSVSKNHEVIFTTCSLKLRRKDGNIREYLQPYVEIEEAFERGIVYCLVRKRTHTKIPVVSERAEKMIWPSEYRSMADAWELSGEEGRDKLR